MSERTIADLVAAVNEATSSDTAPVIEASDAIKRHIYREANVKFDGPSGPLPATTEELSQLVDALLRWAGRYLPTVDLSAVRAYRDQTVRGTPAVVASGLPPPAGADTGAMRRAADTALNEMRNRLPSAAPVGEGPPPRPDLSGCAQGILTALADGQWHTAKQIARQAGYAYSTVRRELPDLIRGGLVAQGPDGYRRA
jgi:hypothetical protein